MAALPSNLRRDLERAINSAREIAVEGSRSALEALTVHEGKRGSHVTGEQQIALRNHLRAHAKQIGDRRNSQSGAQAIDRLVQECAYEHWHRMIFARFLAENSQLVEPDSQVTVTLEDVEELAREEGIDRWELAGRFAQKSLPAIFRADDPLLQLTLPRETRLQLDALLDGLPSETFLADDSLGWVYQFWQSAQKDRVNSEGEKITGETLSAVTQLFTEHYMVLFLLHNTVGAWHAGKVLAERPELAATAVSESALRNALRLTEAGGYDFEYLRFVRSPASNDADESSGPWRPLGGTFEGWPKRAAELQVLDPCCGSGHFLVAAFELLVRLRMREEGLTVTEAVDAVIRNNLFGLELDARCTQIAAFNVAVASWKLTGPRSLPPMKNIACTGLSVGVPRETWMQALEEGGPTNLRFYFGQLYEMFSNASTLGSLINPNRFLGSHSLKKAEMDRLFQSLDAVIAKDPSTAPEQHELGVAAQGLARAAELLAGQYHVVLTNVPYLGRGRQDDILKTHIETYYDLGKADLATVFILRCLEFCEQQGTSAVVSPQNWLFLNGYSKLRQMLLSEKQWNLVARLGPGAFDAIGGEVVNVSLVAITSSVATANHKLACIDVSTKPDALSKSASLRENAEIQAVLIDQSQQLKNPDFRVITEVVLGGALLSEYASSIEGLTTGDMERFIGKFWERSGVFNEWQPFVQSVNDTCHYGGRSDVVLWENDGGQLRASPTAHNFPSRIMNGRQILGKRGVRVAQMPGFACTIYLGEVFGKNAASVVPHELSDLPAIWCFLKSPEFERSVRAIDHSLKVTNATFTKVPFNAAHWRNVASQEYPNGLPEPESDDATQWLFHGHPAFSLAPTQVALARLLGYRWPAELDGNLHLSDRARGLAQSCESLLPHADEDGIVCIPSVRGEEMAAVRLGRMLDACNLKSPHDLEDWLRNDFFKEHCELFRNTPFIWHIWDGRKMDGFHALVNYHKLAGAGGHKLLENLTYSYLGDWINRQESDVKRGESGADGRLAAAKTLQERLIAILAGEPPCDIFVRWKPLSEQPIGWNPDVNDGVRVNIRPFMSTDIPGGRAGAGVLRWGPKIKWPKDKGKEPKRSREDFPWFWNWDESIDFAGGDTFTGDRWNDCHYTNAFKQKARQATKGKKS